MEANFATWMAIARACRMRSVDVRVPLPVARDDVPPDAARAMEHAVSALYGSVLPWLNRHNERVEQRVVRLTFLWSDDGAVVPAVASERQLYRVAELVTMDDRHDMHDLAVIAMAAALADYAWSVDRDAAERAVAWFELALMGNVWRMANMITADFALKVNVCLMYRLAREHDDQEQLGDLTQRLAEISREATGTGTLTFAVRDGRVRPVLLYDTPDGTKAFFVRRHHVSGVAELAALSDAPRGIALWKQLAELLTRDEL